MGRYRPHGVLIEAIEDRILAVIYQYLTSLSSGKCEVKMLSKMNFLNLAEEAVCKQKVAEFVETVASNHASLSKYLESDENFNSSFRMSCIRLAATSSYVYHFLAAIKLVGEDRPTTFPTIINLLHVATSPKKHHRTMTGLLIKVIVLISCIMSGAHAWD